MGQHSGSSTPPDHEDDAHPSERVAVSDRRRFLVTAVATTGVVGIGLVAYPLIKSMGPSARAKAAGGPVQINVGRLKPGEQLTVEWRGKPVWVLRRTPEMVARMSHPHWLKDLRDPDSRVASQQPAYAQNPTRSIRPDLFVAVALCTHLGCVPRFRPDVTASDLGEDWMGGYFCPCHGSRFDLAGRVTKNVPAPTNLIIPPHRFVDADQLEIGVDDA